MFYNKMPYVVGFQQEPERKFDLYADELEALAKFAATTGKKELAEIMARLAEYSRAKAQRGNGPTHFIYK